jgi:hypothetical protein
MLSGVMEAKFLEAAGMIFDDGWKLGSPDGPFLAASHNNYLTRGIVEYFSRTGRSELAASFFKKISPHDKNLNGIIAKCLLESNFNKSALNMVCDTIFNEPFNFQAILTATEILLNQVKIIK